MKDKLNLILLAVIGVFAFVLFFGFILSNIDRDNKLEAFTLAISFVGIFATFGGAYLGAKISANTAIKLSRLDKNIENSKNMLITMREINNIREKIIEKLKDNIIKLGELEKKRSHYDNDLKELETEYKEWQSYYSEMKIYVISTELNQSDIFCLKEPSYLYPYLKDYMNRFTYDDFNGEGRPNIGIYDEKLKEYEEFLKDSMSKLYKLEKVIENMEEKILSQFPE
ncbi:hypothetical protein MTW76_01095 [Mammaliicoccus sciuri]|nr:hypothetical protein [Mammaliicoccus sciuri]MCJ0933567.1 hypothetical protein [Mammaliicoccus sciuri]